MNRPELIQRILNKEITEAKVYEIIAAVSLCVDTLSDEESHYLSERYFGFFHINKGKLGLKCSNIEDFYKILERENNRRKKNNEALIKYDKDKIFQSIWH